MRRRLAVVVFFASLVTTLSVQAHNLGLSVFTAFETGAGEYKTAWHPSSQLKKQYPGVVPGYAAHCTTSNNTLSCDPHKAATVWIEQLPSHATVVARIKQGNQPTAIVPLGTSPVALSQANGNKNYLTHYFLLGVKHILIGLDHLLFVLTIILLIGFTRNLVFAVTAFTVSHSITLALNIFGWITLSVPVVELVIALSIVLLVREVLTQRESLTRRWPWIAAFIFGLVHGLGFASVLQQIGLPGNHEFVALLGFNLGVEAGQLAVIAVFFALSRVLSMLAPSYTVPPSYTAPPSYTIPLRLAAIYGTGIAGAYWVIERAMPLMMG